MTKEGQSNAACHLKTDPPAVCPRWDANARTQPQGGGRPSHLGYQRVSLIQERPAGAPIQSCAISNGVSFLAFPSLAQESAPQTDPPPHSPCGGHLGTLEVGGRDEGRAS